MIKNIILITLILSLFLLGCQKKEIPAEEPTVTPAETDISIQSEISEIDSLDEELDLGELENLEAELDEIDW